MQHTLRASLKHEPAVCAPMVRYSKLPFRQLVREFGVDVAHTPMMLAHEFIRSSIARDSDFTTCESERQPTADGREHALIAQFASSDPTEFARAAELIGPWVDGVDLNCGCPQSWALKEGIGCALMEDAELVAKMVRAAKHRLGPTKSVACKIRIHKDLQRTLQWIKTVEEAGVDYVTVHGRTRSQRSSTPPDYEAIRQIKLHARVPVVANGDVYTLADVGSMVSLTQVDGVMTARGMLQHPALFADREVSPRECVWKFLEHVVKCPIPFPLVLHHVADMTTGVASLRKQKSRLMQCRDLVDLIDFLREAVP